MKQALLVAAPLFIALSLSACSTDVADDAAGDESAADPEATISDAVTLGATQCGLNAITSIATSTGTDTKCVLASDAYGCPKGSTFTAKSTGAFQCTVIANVPLTTTSTRACKANSDIFLDNKVDPGRLLKSCVVPDGYYGKSATVGVPNYACPAGTRLTFTNGILDAYRAGTVNVNSTCAAGTCTPGSVGCNKYEVSPAANSKNGTVHAGSVDSVSVQHGVGGAYFKLLPNNFFYTTAVGAAPVAINGIKVTGKYLAIGAAGGRLSGSTEGRYLGIPAGWGADCSAPGRIPLYTTTSPTSRLSVGATVGMTATNFNPYDASPGTYNGGRCGASSASAAFFSGAETYACGTVAAPQTCTHDEVRTVVMTGFGLK